MCCADSTLFPIRDLNIHLATMGVLEPMSPVSQRETILTLQFWVCVCVLGVVSTLHLSFPDDGPGFQRLLPTFSAGLVTSWLSCVFPKLSFPCPVAHFKGCCLLRIQGLAEGDTFSLPLLYLLFASLWEGSACSLRALQPTQQLASGRGVPTKEENKS